MVVISLSFQSSILLFINLSNSLVMVLLLMFPRMFINLSNSLVIVLVLMLPLFGMHFKIISVVIDPYSGSGD